MSISATPGEDRDESIFERLARESAERASPADEREAVFERLREFEAAEVGALDSQDIPDEPSAERNIALSKPVITYATDKPAAVVTLNSPFDIDGSPVIELRINVPTYGDVEAVTNGEITVLDLYARMAGVTVDTLRALRWNDMEAFSKKARRIAPELVGR